MALYTNLSPEDALAKWYAIRQKPPAQLTPEERDDIAGNMTGLSQQNPEAWRLVRTGIDTGGKTRQIFNPQTGQWQTQQKHGFFSHPESWIQLGLGAGLGTAGALGAFGAAGGAGTAGSTAASTIPTYGAGAPAYGAGAASAAGTAATGGTLGRILSTAERVSGPLSAMSTGRQYGREVDLAAQQRQQALDQQQQRLDQEAPFLRAQQAVRGDQLANTQDFHWGAPTWMGPIPIPTSTGGRRPSILSSQTRELGRQLSQQALTPPPPRPSMLPGRSRFNSILDNAAMYSGLLGAFYHPRMS